MTPNSDRRSGALLVLAAFLALAAAPPAAGQLFDFGNTVLLSRQDLYPGYNDVWGFVGNNGHEYIIQGTTTGTAWWDVDDPSNPVHVKFLSGAVSTWRDMFVIGDYAYAGTEGGGGIQIIDISDPTDPTTVGYYTATVNSCHNIFGDVARQLVYVAGGNQSGGGLQVLDASNPTSLVQIGSWPVHYFHDVSALGTRVYGSMIYENKMRILDVTDPSNPVSLGITFPDGNNHASWPFPDGVHVALASESRGGHVKIVNASNPGNPTLADESDPDPTTSIHNVHVEGTRMVCSWYSRGARIYDVSDPTAIAEIGFFDTYPDASPGLFDGNWGVYPHLPSGLIAANDRKYGLFLLKYDPDAARLDGIVSSSAGGVIDGAEVTLGGTTQTMTTGATGAYRLSSVPGSRDIQVAVFGHEPLVVNVTAAAAATTTTDIVLTKLPAGALGGRVTDASSGLPIASVTLALEGTPLVAQTDGNGDYSFPDVPALPSATYALDLQIPGYGIPNVFVTIPIGGTATRDLALEPASVYVDFSSPTGWTVSNGPGTTRGFWEFGEPKGTYVTGIPVQPELDHSLDPEDQCAVTGNTAGAPDSYDVDGGATRLLSPVYDLSALASPHLLYYRWYASNGGTDAWETHVTTNGGANWTLVDSATSDESFWQGVDIDLTPLTGSAPAVQFRFTCQDPPPDQLVDGALDDFTLYDASLGAVSAPVAGKQAAWTLDQNAPNPFRGNTRIRFSVGREEHVLLSVFDVAGRRVATLVDGVLPAGVHEAQWDGGRLDGSRTAAGVYFYKLRTTGRIDTRKMVRVR